MTQYVDKAKLLAKLNDDIQSIEKRLMENESYDEDGCIAWECDKTLYDYCYTLKSFINDQLEPISIS